MAERKDQRYVIELKEKSMQSSEDERGDGSSGGFIPFEQGSILMEESRAMENARRLEEQQGHRQYASVNQRERQNNEQSADNALEAQAGPKEHPYLKQSQRFDGIDPNLNPAPDIGTDARREYDNERREAEKEKQLRLGNMPKFSNAPENKPG